MSALGGIYNFDGAPVDQRLLAALGHLLADRGPDGGREFVSDSVGMAFRAFHTNSESRFERQPLVSSNKLIVALDGRIDNRDQLLALLRDSRGDETDVEIVFSAYSRYGVDCFGKLIGDFALAIWDPHLQVLLLGRDAFGVRPLFYSIDRATIIWASDLRSLVGLVGTDREIDDDYVAGFLTQFPEPWQTPFKGVDAVPPGHVVRIQNGRIDKWSFWNPQPTPEIRYKCDAEYEEHLRALLYDAVRCRLRADRPVFIECSGGLDSSSVACIGDHILKRGEAPAPSIETVSYVYDEARTSDERRFIRAVEEKRGKAGYHILEEEYPCLAPSANGFFVGAPTFGHCFAKRKIRLSQIMQEAGARVLLTGQGGDQLFYSNTDPDITFADLIHQRKLLELHRQLQDWSLTLKKPYLQLLWSGAVLLLPRSTQALFRPTAKLPDWFDKEFVARMGLRERMLGPATVDGSLPSMRDQATAILSVVRSLAAAHSREWACIEISHPYLHLPLVEFLQSVPLHQKIRPGETRSLMRRTLRNVLPEIVAKRRGKQGPDEALCRALSNEWPRLKQMFANARVCAYGYINSKDLMAALHRARFGAEKHTFSLLMTISLEFWLRSLEQRNEAAKSTVPIKGQAEWSRTV
ncbi:MAG TPA: asparagine synthase-related protein [Pyrinomonadaceae bacterium]|jgi:asparagine synthase (glutamine-hydrolysing)